MMDAAKHEYEFDGYFQALDAHTLLPVSAKVPVSARFVFVPVAERVDFDFGKDVTFNLRNRKSTTVVVALVRSEDCKAMWRSEHLAVPPKGSVTLTNARLEYAP